MGSEPPSWQPLLLLASEAALGSTGLVHRASLRSRPSPSSVSYEGRQKHSWVSSASGLQTGTTSPFFPPRADPETAAAPDRGSEWVRPAGKAACCRSAAPRGCHRGSRAWVEGGSSSTRRGALLPSFPECPMRSQTAQVQVPPAPHQPQDLGRLWSAQCLGFPFCKTGQRYCLPCSVAGKTR